MFKQILSASLQTTSHDLEQIDYNQNVLTGTRHESSYNFKISYVGMKSQGFSMPWNISNDDSELGMNKGLQERNHFL